MIKNIPKRRFKGFNDEWEEKKLGEIGVFTSSGVDKKINKNHEEVYLLNYMDVYNRINLNNINKKRLMKVTATKEQLLKNDILKNDIFFTPSSETPDDIGRVMVIEETLKNVVYSYHLMRFRPNSNVFHSTFPNYSFETTCFRKNLILNSQGVQRYVLNKDSFENLISFIPSLLEQQKIGDFFQKLDKQISLYDQKINKLKDLKKSYLNKMFPKENMLYPELRFKGFNDKWGEKKLGLIAKRFDNLRIPITESNRIAGTTPYYGANGILDYVEGFTHNGEYILIAEDGVSDLNNYPVYYVNGKVWVNNHAHVIQTKEGISDNRFLQYLFTVFRIEPYLVGGSRAKLNANIMMDLLICIPVINEQIKIGGFFSKLDSLINLYQDKYNKIKDLKKAYLNEMFVNK